MEKAIRYVLLVLSLLIYIYNVQLKAIPIAPKTLMAAPGLIYFYIDFAHGHLSFNVLQKYFRLFDIVLVLFTWGIITMGVNGSSEMLYFAYIKYFFLWLFAVYFLCHLAKGIISSFLDLCKIITIVVTLESITAFFMKFVPAFAMIVNNIQEMEVYRVGVDYYMDTGDLTDFMRIIGLGNAVFFGVLTSCTLGLISCAYVLYHNGRKWFYVICYIIITCVSIMTARTSVVSVILSLALILYYNAKRSGARAIKSVFLISVGAFGVISFAFAFLPDNMLEWQMELFSQHGKNNDEVERVTKWIIDQGFEFKTFLIGDAHYNMGDFSYYKGVDVGYYRQIFYSGIIGLGIIVFYNVKILKYVKRSDIHDKSLGPYVAMLFICYLFFMFKGDINYVELYLLLLMMFDFSINKKIRVK